MKKIINKAMRNVKDFFVEPVSDFQFEELESVHKEPLFDAVAVEPITAHSQPGNQEAVLNAFERAVLYYYLGNIAPLLRNVPNLRWQIKQIQLRETAENTSALMEINKLSPSILNAIAIAILKKLPCAKIMDISQFYGVSIVPESDLIGRTLVMWANIGQEKTAINFSFDDDIIEVEEDGGLKTPDDMSEVRLNDEQGDELKLALAADFHLKLIDARGEREITLTQFPVMVGNSPKADIHVENAYVSAQHLVFHWDALLQCVYLLDRSKHGTFVGDVGQFSTRRLALGERLNLLGAGSFQLTQLENAPRFEFWHGDVAGKGTALLPPQVEEMTQNLASLRQAESVSKASQLDQPVSLLQALQEGRLTPGAAEKARVGANTVLGHIMNGAARSTMLAGNGNVKSKPLAWLQIRNAKKQVETVAITSLPFCIGREIDGNGYPVDEAYVKVSRRHLRILEQRGSVFGVYNNSLNRPGQSNVTVGEKGAESQHFVWVPQLKNSNSGWRVLGSHRLDGESIEVRLLSA